MNSKWTSDHLISFIELYEQHPVLYNVKDTNYSNKLKRDAALQKLFEEAKAAQLPVISMETLKKKIKSIRDTYHAEFTKVKKSQQKTGSDPNDIYTPTLTWYYHADKFLNEHFASRNTTSNLEIALNTVTQTDDDDSLINLDDPDSPMSSAYTGSSSSTTSNRKKRKISESEQILKKYEPILNRIEALKKEENPKDACDVFGAYIGTQLKQLPKVRQILAQQQMTQILTNHLLEEEEGSLITTVTCHNDD